MQLDSQTQRQLRLLEWLQDQGPSGHDVAPLYADLELSPDVARSDLRHLDAIGFLDVYFAGGEVGRGTLKQDGLVYLEEIRARRSSKLERRGACRGSLLNWLSRNGADSVQSRTGWDGLLSDDRSNFYGDTFSPDEIDHAAAWLMSNGFIDGITTGQTEGPVTSWLTDLGLECVEQFDGNLATFNSSRTTGAAGGMTVVNYGNAQISTGAGVNQQMTLNVAVSEVRNEVLGLIEIMEAFGVAGVQALLSFYESVVDEQAGSDARQSRLNDFAERLKKLAGSVVGDSRSAIVTLAVTQILENLHSIVTSMH